MPDPKPDPDPDPEVMDADEVDVVDFVGFRERVRGTPWANENVFLCRSGVPGNTPAVFIDKLMRVTGGLSPSFG